MTKWYHYVLTVYLRLATSSNPCELKDELDQYLGEGFQISELQVLDEDGNAAEEVSFLLQLQTAFSDSQMDCDEPTADALDEMDRELTSYLEAKYVVNHLELLDDALTSYLLGETDSD